MIIWLRKKR